MKIIIQDKAFRKRNHIWSNIFVHYAKSYVNKIMLTLQTIKNRSGKRITKSTRYGPISWIIIQNIGPYLRSDNMQL